MPDAVRAFVGNFKGPKGEQGPQGIQGPTGPQGIQGPAGPSNADGIDTVDTLGVLVSAGESTDLQRLIDAIADKVMTKLLAKTVTRHSLIPHARVGDVFHGRQAFRKHFLQSPCINGLISFQGT